MQPGLHPSFLSPTPSSPSTSHSLPPRTEQSLLLSLAQVLPLTRCSSACSRFPSSSCCPFDHPLLSSSHKKEYYFRNHDEPQALQLLRKLLYTLCTVREECYGVVGTTTTVEGTSKKKKQEHQDMSETESVKKKKALCVCVCV